jgi:hypothetical protein
MGNVEYRKVNQFVEDFRGDRPHEIVEGELQPCDPPKVAVVPVNRGVAWILAGNTLPGFGEVERAGIGCRQPPVRVAAGLHHEISRSPTLQGPGSPPCILIQCNESICVGNLRQTSHQGGGQKDCQESRCDPRIAHRGAKQNRQQRKAASREVSLHAPTQTLRTLERAPNRAQIPLH